MNKTCSQCGTKKVLEEFSKDKRQRFGRRPECKTCEHLRPSYLLKAIRFRLKHSPEWYKNIKSDLTQADVIGLGRICHFCHKFIADGASIHRLDHRGNYTIGNIVMVHKTCHAKYGKHNKGSRIRG